jgi:4-oxalocrotonate tautomerase
MPHVTAKMWPGKSEDQKRKLAADITQAVTSALNCVEDSAPAGLEAVEASNWTEQVSKPDVLAKLDILYKKPGY